jgi:hypothetical protein
MSVFTTRAAGAVALCIGIALGAAEALAAPMAPVYLTTFNDAVTGDAPNAYLNTDNKRRWTIDAGADSYQNDFYERPTAKTYEVNNVSGGGGEIFAASEYLQHVDIVQGRAGYDSQYLYISIDLFGRNKHTDDNTQTEVGLVERYGFRIGGTPTDPTSRGGYLLVADAPELKNGTAYGALGMAGWHDVNFDVGGTGMSVTKQDLPSEVSGNGYESEVIVDGKIKSGPNANQVALYSRVSPTDNTVVEFALDYALLGLSLADIQNLSYLEFEAIKGGPKDRANYVWNDEYNKSEAGSPYRGAGALSEFGTQGLVNIYELDTLRGGAIPEPSGVVALLSVIAAGVFARRR